MKVGRAQIIVFVPTVALLIVVMRMIVTMIFMVMAMVSDRQKHRADYIHHQSDYGDKGRLAEGNRLRRDETTHAFYRNAKCDDAQDKGRRKAREVSDLTSSEAELPVFGVPSCEGIGSRRHSERPRMGRHVKAVGEQRHRSKDGPCDDLANHHYRAKRNHPQSAARIVVMCASEELFSTS